MQHWHNQFLRCFVVCWHNCYKISLHLVFPTKADLSKNSSSSSFFLWPACSSCLSLRALIPEPCNLSAHLMAWCCLTWVEARIIDLLWHPSILFVCNLLMSVVLFGYHVFHFHTCNKIHVWNAFHELLLKLLSLSSSGRERNSSSEETVQTARPPVCMLVRLSLGEAASPRYIQCLHVFIPALITLCSTFSPGPHVISVSQIWDVKNRLAKRQT